MRQEERLRPPPLDAGEAVVPRFEVDIRRRRRRHHVAVGHHLDACGVADEGDARVRGEVAHVMRGVAGCVRHLERSPAFLDAFAAVKDDQRLLRHRRDLTPEAVHRVAVQARRARQQLPRIDQVRRSLRVNEDAQLGVLADQRPGRSGVIEMDMRNQERGDVTHGDPGPFELPFQGPERAGRSGIDERDAAGPLSTAVAITRGVSWN